MDLPAGIGPRIGVLGGTFDPVHNGHLAMAAAARREFALDAVVLIPAAQPPHKLDHRISSFEDRVAMLALVQAPGLLVSTIEAERRGPSYSIDTLRVLRHGLVRGTELFFLIGIDAFAEIGTWKEYGVLPALARLVVVDRPGQRPGRVASLVRRHFPGFAFDHGARCWRGREDGAIYFLAMEPVPVSSTLVRERARKGQSLAGLVPSEVARFITAHNLYR